MNQLLWRENDIGENVEYLLDSITDPFGGYGLALRKRFNSHKYLYIWIINVHLHNNSSIKQHNSVVTLFHFLMEECVHAHVYVCFAAGMDFTIS